VAGEWKIVDRAAQRMYDLERIHLFRR
jgi:hypothetical protein